MGAHLITGYGGKEHITAADQGGYNAGTLGSGKYVLPLGSVFSYEIISNNLVKIRDGELVNQGRHINIPVNDYEECEIDNGIQALKRNDLIVIRYEKNPDTGIESANMVVIKGVSGEIAVDPDYITGNIFNGDNTDDFPLYRIKLNGLNITAVEPLFNTIISFKSLLDLVGNTSIDDIGNGTITDAIVTQRNGINVLNTNFEELSTNVNNMATTFKFTCNGVTTSNGVYIKDPDGKPLKSGGYKIDLLSTTALTNEVASSYIINIAGGIFYKTVIHEGAHNASPRIEYNSTYGLYVLLANYSTPLSVSAVVTRL